MPHAVQSNGADSGAAFRHRPTIFAAAVAAYERALLEDALSRNRFNQRATAAALGLSYDQLRHALKRHKLTEARPPEIAAGQLAPQHLARPSVW